MRRISNCNATERHWNGSTLCVVKAWHQANIIFRRKTPARDIFYHYKLLRIKIFGKFKMLRKNYAPGHRGDVLCYGLRPISLKVVVNKTCDEFTAWVRFNTSISRPRQNDLRFQDEIFKSIFLNKHFCILMKISRKICSLVQGPIEIFQHWFRWWLGSGQATKNYPSQWRFNLMTHICTLGPNDFMSTEL